MVRVFNSCCSFREGHLSSEDEEAEEGVALSLCFSAGNFCGLCLGVSLSTSACVDSSNKNESFHAVPLGMKDFSMCDCLVFCLKRMAARLQLFTELLK